MEICPHCHSTLPASQPEVCGHCGWYIGAAHWESIRRDRRLAWELQRDRAEFEHLRERYRTWFDSIAAATMETRRDMLAAYAAFLARPDRSGLDHWELFKFFPLSDWRAPTWNGGWEPNEAAILLLKHWIQGLFSQAAEPEVMALWQKVCAREAHLLRPTEPVARAPCYPGLIASLSIFTGFSLLVCGIIWLAFKKDDVAVGYAQEGINHQITFISGFLILYWLLAPWLISLSLKALAGFVAFAWIIIFLVTPIIAAIKAFKGEAYRYPLVVHFFGDVRSE